MEVAASNLQPCKRLNYRPPRPAHTEHRQVYEHRVEYDWIPDSFDSGIPLDAAAIDNQSGFLHNEPSGSDLGSFHDPIVEYPSSTTPYFGTDNTSSPNKPDSSGDVAGCDVEIFPADSQMHDMSNQSGQCVKTFSLNHPLGIAKHICAICGDRASGKHYGVYSCEGCKGFFKRTVRKDLNYTCRENRHCIIDKRQRNRCQYCRYQKCLTMGMKREAVQEERHRLRSDRSEGEPESTSNCLPDMPPERILEAELVAGQNQENIQLHPVESIESIERQLEEIVDWALMIPHFSDLPIEDQALLVHTGWNELILAVIAFRSTTDTLILPSGQPLTRFQASQAGAAQIFDRIASELTAKFQEFGVDRTELGCLRTIILYNPDVNGLKSSLTVESFREKVYCCLEEYCKRNNPAHASRFAKLLLRLPALRSIGIKCLDCLNLIPAVPSMGCLLHTLRLRMSIKQESHSPNPNIY